MKMLKNRRSKPTALNTGTKINLQQRPPNGCCLIHPNFSEPPSPGLYYINLNAHSKFFEHILA